MDAGDAASSQYKIMAFPTTLFIDRSGNVVSRVEGGMDKSSFEAELSKIL